ncbi:MAG: tetratricopeptide repeat protein [Clostridia bacterium]|jgi:tetratricopeptide (TPR) repeat protein|nr:tetratricopeptide repeat protein [Clostridia bacterium]
MISWLIRLPLMVIWTVVLFKDRPTERFIMLGLIFIAHIIEYKNYKWINIAWTKAKSLEFEEMKICLDKIRFTSRFMFVNKGFYLWMRSMYLTAVVKDYEKAQELAEAALKAGVRTEKNRALMYVHMAEILTGQNNFDKALGLIEEARKIDPSEEVEKYISESETNIKGYMNKTKEN